ncbi:MAG: phage tail assembly protein [Burkholderiaceae bacterium]|jgi:hypothetical protein|nr:phage tail assembly protein [Burkholderiaceae bacterium]
MDNQEKTIDLAYPVRTPDGSVLKQIKITRIKARHIKGMDISELQKLDGNLQMMARMNNLPNSVMDELDMADISKAMEVLQSFLEDTGGGTPPS